MRYEPMIYNIGYIKRAICVGDGDILAIKHLASGQFQDKVHLAELNGHGRVLYKVYGIDPDATKVYFHFNSKGDKSGFNMIVSRDMNGRRRYSSLLSKQSYFQPRRI